MGRQFAVTLACLLLGAGGMWVASNFKVRFESASGPDRPAPPVPHAPAEPGLFPAHLRTQAIPGVVQAGASFPAALAAAPLGIGADPDPLPEQVLEVTETLGVQTVNWGAPSNRILLATNAPTLVFAALGSVPTVKVRVGDTDQAIAGTVSASEVPLDLTKLPASVQFAPGRPLKVEVTRSTADMPPKRSVSTVTVVRPLANAEPTQLFVDKAGPTKVLPPKNLASNTTVAVVNDYLRVQGRGLGGFDAATFFVLVSDKLFSPNQSNRVTLPPRQQDEWEYELLLKPQATNAKGRLLVRGDFPGGHMFALAEGDFQFTKDPDPLPAPLLAVAKATSDTNTAHVLGAPSRVVRTGLDTVHTNTRVFRATVTANARAKAVALYVDGKLHDVRDSTGAAVVFDEIAIGDGQEHVLRAEALLGNASSPAAQLALDIVTTPPTVDGVSAPGFGQSNGVGTEKIRVRFGRGNPLDRTSAETLGNYEVRNLNAADTTERLQDLPVLEDTTNSVTLTVNKIVAGSYAVRVKTALKDVYGNTLAAQHETTLFTGTVDAPQPSQTAGVFASGPNAVFPEYTKFRELKDGFNPSDRVETRVVRLYYARDAHRVAQIVNRDLKSYNAPAVDVRRRAADRVRDEANAAQDERQRLERAAVTAAVTTRAAENELRQIEASLQQARTDQATARVQLTQREEQLSVAQRELERVGASTAERARNNPVVEDQRARLLQMDEDIRLTEAGKNGLQEGDRRIPELETRLKQLRLAREREERALAVLVKDAEATADRGIELNRVQVRNLQDEVAKLRQTQASAADTERLSQQRITEVRGRVQSLRTEEYKATEAALGKDSDERRKREEQFRREVAAALADPDSYAAGKPESVDPVLQCSISVIGEGLIQIRGPVKGLNVIRTMINQIDAPVGQVRVGVHTIQVNGERVDRMDKVVMSIQRYLDHSRFLTTQSAQMLRKAVTTVASRHAVQAAQSLAPGCTQQDRDLKYLHCFFGKDFIDELRSLDSEFLVTGNKILSLHSMDSTSLSSALFLMALAKNDIREEILQEFQAQVRTRLPQAEMNFYLAGLACPGKCEACCDKNFCVLAQNARFESFLGFFNTEVVGNDTLTPIQREFIRLAQIFKSRMVTELELKQRVMERTILEDRVGNYMEEQRKAKTQEDAAKAEQVKYQLELQTSIVKATTAFGQISKELDSIEQELDTLSESLRQIVLGQAGQINKGGVSRELPQSSGERVGYSGEKTKWMANAFREAAEYLKQFHYISSENYNLYKNVYDKLIKLSNADSATKDELGRLRIDILQLFGVVRQQIIAARATVSAILVELRKERPNIEDVLQKYIGFRESILTVLRDGETLKETAKGVFTNNVGPAFQSLQNAFVAAQASARSARLTRRSLDEKKLLDMLVDDMEEKYIELLDGTRAHTANVDNYLKALSTALDDDFMTQFYQPAFSKVRTLGANWDVQLGQIESTTVLTNNRAFGKVSPTASMEFDLPRRDILIKEAFKGAKAAVQDYGALLNDPVFLSMVKLYGGNPVSAQFGGAGGLPAVRNVLPGLPGSADEMIMAQAGPSHKEFGTNLESLIPDPAIYKIETGTGYEIRPVLSPDGQSVVFGFDYMYTTDIREPVRADEKHLGRVKRHFVHTDVQLGNFEMREVSKYWVSLKVARTGKGVALLQDIPGVGALFRPAPSAGSSLQQNLIYSQAAIFPTLFDLMGLRYAPAIADVTPERIINDQFVVTARRDYLRAFIFDYGASRVDDALRIMYGERRADLYRSQHSIPSVHPNGYRGPGLRQRDSQLEEEYKLEDAYPPSRFIPGMHLPPSGDRSPGGPFDLDLPPGATVPGHPTLGQPLGTTYQYSTPPGAGPYTRPETPLPVSPPSALPPPPNREPLPGVRPGGSVPVPPRAPPMLPPVPPSATAFPGEPVALPRNQFFPGR